MPYPTEIQGETWLDEKNKHPHLLENSGVRIMHDISAEKSLSEGTMRFCAEPRDVPPEGTGRRLAKPLAEFQAVLLSLFAQPFPKSWASRFEGAA